MVGIPQSINTKDDVANLIDMALSAKLGKSDVKAKLEGLFSDEKVWAFKSVVTDGYQPLEGEKIMVGHNKRLICYELTDNPTAAYLLMGYTKEELTEIINQL